MLEYLEPRSQVPLADDDIALYHNTTLDLLPIYLQASSIRRLHVERRELFVLSRKGKKWISSSGRVSPVCNMRTLFQVPLVQVGTQWNIYLFTVNSKCQVENSTTDKVSFATPVVDLSANANNLLYATLSTGEVYRSMYANDVWVLQPLLSQYNFVEFAVVSGGCGLMTGITAGGELLVHGRYLNQDYPEFTRVPRP